MLINALMTQHYCTYSASYIIINLVLFYTHIYYNYCNFRFPCVHISLKNNVKKTD